MASLLPFNKLLFPRISFFFFRFGVICFFANLIFLSSPTVSSTERSKVASGLKVWVFFSDKGIDNQSLSPVRFLDEPIPLVYLSTIKDQGAKIHHQSRWLNAVSANISPENHQSILSLPFVQSIGPVRSYRNIVQKPVWLNQKNNIFSAPSEGEKENPIEYGLAKKQVEHLQADFLHKKGYWGKTVVIGILDTGFDLSHQSLNKIEVLDQWDFVNNDPITKDEPDQDDVGQSDHGSIILGVLAANTPRQLVGLAPQAKYLLAKTEKNWHKGIDFERQIEEDWWIAGLEWLEQKGAQVVNSSLGYANWYRFSDLDGKTSKVTIAANIALEKGVLVISASGNLGAKLPEDQRLGLRGRITVPADGFDVLAIGSINRWGKRSVFSSPGPTVDGRIKPDLVALGEGIASIRPRSQFGFATNHRGTSLSAPLISGVAALLIQAFPRVTATDLVSILRNTASNSAQPNNEVGYGVVRAELAHQSLLDKFLHVGQPEPILIDKKKSLKTLFGQIKSPLIRPNYPNPFNAETWIPFSLPANGNVQISIYDFAGYLVQKMRIGECDAGDYLDTNQAVYWDGRDKSGQAITSGNYFAVLSVDGRIYPAMKMTLQE